MGLFKKLFTPTSEREIKKIKPIIDKIESYEPEYAALTDEALKNKTNEFKHRISNGETLDDILPEAFATVREASRRVTGMFPYRVQLIGGVILHQGRIAEMRTGEGKANPVDTPIPTPDGWKTVGDIKIGDYLFDRCGNPTKVTGVYPQGVIDTYEVYLRDGRTIKCAEDHLWGVYDAQDNNSYKVMKTIDLYNLGDFSNFALPVNGAVDYCERDLETDPYIIGYNSKGNISIPEIYKISSIEQRVSLIQGILDAYGEVDIIDNKYNILVPVKSSSLKNDILEVIYSLGYSGFYTIDSDGDKGYVVHIEVPHQIKCSLFRDKSKQDIFKNLNHIEYNQFDRVQISEIKRLDTKSEQVCFTVDNFEHLFLIGNYVVTHNTLVAVLPSYLNALTGESVHVITVNDYLADRDASEMGRIHSFLGLKVGVLVHDTPPYARKEIYSRDIIYGTNHEFGFDYLRDNMMVNPNATVQRKLNFAIIDEVDSILIDEARTPLIISGASDRSSDMYIEADKLAKTMTCYKLTEIDSRESTDDYDSDYAIDEKHKSLVITAAGYSKIEKYFNIKNSADPENAEILHYMNQALRANSLMERDRDYIIENGEVIIVDEFTGRLMHGRQYNNGLHQAIEAKEGLEVKKENITLATITLQNYFRMYSKLSGMTGTAKTEEEELGTIYKIDVVEIPTNKPVIRKDHNDKVYASIDDKYNAIVNTVRNCNAKGQPILIGTTSVEKSEKLSSLLHANNIDHSVLNAKNHRNEAMLVSKAGRFGRVTIATNMAGRGTDIILGGNPEQILNNKIRNFDYNEFIGEFDLETCTKQLMDISLKGISKYTGDNPLIKHANKLYHENHDKIYAECAENRKKVVDAGGLFILGTERHESRRIDNQLRGRAGRQGDVGESCFMLSLDDELLRVFGGDKVKSIANMGKGLGGEPIELGMLNSVIERAQKGIESIHYQSRKHTVQYDDVVNQQREIIYTQRRKVMSENNHQAICNMVKDYVESHLMACEELGDGVMESIESNPVLSKVFNSDFFSQSENSISVCSDLTNAALSYYEDKYNNMPVGIRDQLEREILLKNVDKFWREHIDAMTELQKGIGLRGYAQKDPIQEYKNEGIDMFNETTSLIRHTTVEQLIMLEFKFERVEPKIS